jgi:hypothetical protein
VTRKETDMASDDKHSDMVRRELADRAGLLCRLGYSRDDAERRLRGNLEWEYELSPPPPCLDELPGIMDRVWARKGGAHS